MNEFHQAMLELDVALTGNSPEKVTSQFHHYPETIEKWILTGSGDKQWYLSDAGYSRVVFSTRRGRVFLTDNSTAKVKARWEQAVPQRQRVEELVRTWLTSNGWTLPFEESIAHTARQLIESNESS